MDEDRMRSGHWLWSVVSALSVLQCFDTVGWVTRKDIRHVALAARKGSLLEQVAEEK